MRYFILSCLVVILASACAPSTRPEKQAPEVEQQARDLLSGENYTDAAMEYLRLAEEYQTPFYLLRAADSFLLAKDPIRTEQTLARIDPERLTGNSRGEYRVLQARVALVDENPAQALEELDEPLPDNASARLKTDYYQTKALASEQTENFPMAIRERIQLNTLLSDSNARSNNTEAIWKLLSQLEASELTDLRTGAGNELSGWIELARIDRARLYDQESLNTAINDWSSRYPSHPAATLIIPDILARVEKINLQPEIIALLLPFNDQYRGASEAIRKGFLAAWYESVVQRPIIKIYDTGNEDINSIYQQAVSDGADFIVGPLDKKAVASLQQQDDLPVPILALNQLPVNEGTEDNDPVRTVPSMFQFGLLPEEEAANTAERAWFDGHARALVITPDGEWGSRVTSAFTERWQELGGTIIEENRIPAAAEDLSSSVKQLLNVDDSERREKELTATLRRNLHFEPRRRQDADMIFVAAPPVIARQLIPQLDFYRASDMPTYSISLIYPGMNDPQANSDINNVIFSDMPWVVDPVHQQSALQQTLNKNWQQNTSPYRRLYAFGIDAYRIIPHLVKLHLSNEEYAGETGQLRVSKNGTITRRQVWTKVIKGSPRLLDTNFLN